MKSIAEIVAFQKAMHNDKKIFKIESVMKTCELYSGMVALISICNDQPMVEIKTNRAANMAWTKFRKGTSKYSKLQVVDINKSMAALYAEKILSGMGFDVLDEDPTYFDGILTKGLIYSIHWGNKLKTNRYDGRRVDQDKPYTSIGEYKGFLYLCGELVLNFNEAGWLSYEEVFSYLSLGYLTEHRSPG